MSQQPIFANRKAVRNFILITLCSQFAYSVLAMKGVLLPQMLELWNVSKTEFAQLMSLYGAVHIVFYGVLAWAQDRLAPRVIIPFAMVAGGITTFFLGKTSDYYTLCVLFLLLAVLCDGAFWPAVLASVRRSTTDNNQGKAFGLLEGGRGAIEFVQNAGATALYAWFSYSVFGLELAFMVNGSIMIVLGLISWRVLPRNNLLKSSNESGKNLAEVIEGMKLTLRVPEIWLAGFVGFFVYFAYTTFPFYVTYFTDLYTLSELEIAFFATTATTITRIGSGLPAGFIATRLFGGASGALAVGLLSVCVLSLLMALLPPTQDSVGYAKALIFLLMLVIFFSRALYFAPFGEMGIPPRFSGSVIAIAAVVVYLPSAFGYSVWGILQDTNPGLAGYRLTFLGLAIVGIVGASIAVILRMRERRGLGVRARIERHVSRIDEKLSLAGEEKSMTEG